MVLGFSAAGLAGMTATALPLPYPDKLIAEDQVELAAQGHRRGHIGEKSSQARHRFSFFPV